MAKFESLEDVEQCAAEYPESFYIPQLEERSSQEIGDLVRLHFLVDGEEDDPRAERMWVEINVKRTDPVSYTGILTNQPRCIEDLHPGDVIDFEPKHIAQTIIKKSDPRWIDSSDKKAFVSKMCFEPGEFVRFLYRERADRDEDSGWRMFSGKESQEYIDNPENTRIVAVGWMLSRDPSLLQPLKGGVGSVFERRKLSDTWQVVTDWEPSED